MYQNRKERFGYELDSLSGVLGEFWLPTDKTNTVPGILTIEPSSNTRELTLNGRLSELFPFSSADIGLIVIHGCIGSLPVTFTGCFWIDRTISTEKYYVHTIVSGAHITDGSKRVIKRACLRLDNMHSLVPPIPLKYSLQSKGGEYRKLDLSETSDPVIERSSTHFGSIEVHRSKNFHPGQHRLEITSESEIVLTYPEGASISDVIEHCSIILNLSAMMTGTFCNVTLLELVVSLPFAYKINEIKLYPDLIEDRVIKKPSELEVITYTELGGVEAIAKCLNDSHRSPHNAAVLNRLGLFWLSKRPYNEYKFISMTVAIEHLYMWLNDVKKFKELKGKDKELPNQLDNIIRPIADEVGLFIPDTKWLGKKAARYRAWAAHGNLDIPPDELLFTLMCSLYLCIMLRYTHDLGADINAICRKIKSGYTRFREWDNVLKEAMEENP